MKNTFLFILAILCHLTAQSQILPNTVYCIKGSDAHKVEYCADLTPCKVKSGPNGDHTVCLAGTPNPPAGALMSGLSCWSMVTEYTCLQYNSECATYTDNTDCKEQGTRECTRGADSQLMLSSNPKLGQCSSYTRSFSCIDKTKPTNTSTTFQTECDTSSTMGGLDWKTTSPSASQDFVLAATSQEFARQLSLYGAKDGSGISGLFPGVSMGCADGMLGLKNCCDSNAKAQMTNGDFAGKLQLVKTGWDVGSRYAVKVGSEYVLDTIFASGQGGFMGTGIQTMLNDGALSGGFTTRATELAGIAALDAIDVANKFDEVRDAADIADAAVLNDMVQGTVESAEALAQAQETLTAAQNTLTASQAVADTSASVGANAITGGGVGMMGIGTTSSAAGGALFGATGSVAIGNSGLYFNPYALAFSVALKVVMNAMQCTPQEADLATAKKANLCHYIGSYCSKELKVLGKTVGCLETTQSYCCYNGLLAKAVEEGAHVQLGLSWGSPEGPACGGLSPAQIMSLDFSTPAMKDAMKPFQDQIMANFKANVAPNLASGAIQTNATITASEKGNALCLQRKKYDETTVCN